MFLSINQVPRALGFGVLGTPLVMSFDAVFKIVGGPNVVAAVFQASEYVNVKRHIPKKSLLRL